MSLFSGQSKETPEERLRRMELTHAERLKALEMGRPVPEVEIAQARADEVRARAATGWAIVRTIFAVLGPAAISGIAVGATAIVLSQADPGLHATLVTAIWVCSGLVSLGMVAAFLLGAQQLNLPDLLRRQSPRNPLPKDSSIENLDPGQFAADEADRLARAFQK